MGTRSSYEHYKKQWEEIKPIRGRAEVVKPLGDRRRTWETVEHRVINGEDVYACHLYNTDCVMYYPDGSIGFRSETWSTPTTADFISIHSPFYCNKQHGNLWVNVHYEDGTKVYPIPKEGELRLYAEESGGGVVYAPRETITIKRQAVDRIKAKEAREKLRGFLDWAKTFNKLSDGWIHNETREQFGKVKIDYWRAEWDYDLPDKFYYRGNYGGNMINFEVAYPFLQTCDDVGYMKAYLAIFQSRSDAQDVKVARVLSGKDTNGNPTNHMVELCDLKFGWERVKRKIYEIADKASDIHKEVEVPVGSKAVTKVLR